MFGAPRRDVFVGVNSDRLYFRIVCVDVGEYYKSVNTVLCLL